ncbi:MAG TPA: hypothetical protein VNO26_14960 [Candidatus Limnocylindria bacterium]|nr:hypothetical protein [Candidatus Limnocylindria bacterium]
MRRAMRWTNVVISAVALASGLAVLASNLLDAGYRAHYRDSLLVVVAYLAFYAWTLVTFARDGRRTAHLAVAKALGAYLFLATFVAVGPLWMARTPARYVYLLFDWGRDATGVLMTYVLLGRGVWNTLNAMFFTAPWWMPLRTTHPLVGRVVTILPIGLATAFVAAFFELRALERATYSAAASAVAEQVFAGLECDEIRRRQGTETTDVRQRADGERFRVRVVWDCRAVRVYVQDEDGKMGSFAGPRLECCEAVAGRAGRMAAC